MSRIAVVLFNMGGPDSLESVQPFLFNLFNDPAIINVPGPVRWLLARLISRYRTPFARAIYEQIGGRSPLLTGTEAQARALEVALGGRGLEIRVFTAMRYWHPLISEVVEAVRQWHPNQVVLLPLYPQFSSTTTGSSMKEWMRTAGNMKAITTTVCCWPVEHGWITALAELTREGLDIVRAAYAIGSGKQSLRVLFSAHGLPESVIARGDPYQSHVEKTVTAVIIALQEPGLDYEVCYQSHVGSQRWIGPATRDAIRRAGADNTSVVLVPVAFVSEHSETLVELDIEYRHIAETAGVPTYIRVPTVGTHARFIAGLARLVQTALTQGWGGYTIERPGGSVFDLLLKDLCMIETRVT